MTPDIRTVSTPFSPGSPRRFQAIALCLATQYPDSARSHVELRQDAVNCAQHALQNNHFDHWFKITDDDGGAQNDKGRIQQWANGMLQDGVPAEDCVLPGLVLFLGKSVHIVVPGIDQPQVYSPPARGDGDIWIGLLPAVHDDTGAGRDLEGHYQALLPRGTQSNW